MTNLAKLLNSSWAGTAVPNYGGLLLRNQWKFLLGWGLTLARVLLGRLTPLYVIGLYRFAKRVTLLARRNGLRFLVLTLKAEQMLLMQVAGGQRKAPPLDGRKIRRSKCGLPSVIPVPHRIAIMKGVPSVASFWMSLFGLYRVIDFPGQARLETITAPGIDISRVRAEFGDSFKWSLQILDDLVGIPKGVRPSGFTRKIKEDTSTTAMRPWYGVKELLVTLFPIFKSCPSEWTRSTGGPADLYRPKGTKPETAHGWYSLVQSAQDLTRSNAFVHYQAYALGTGNAWFVRVVNFFTTYGFPKPTKILTSLGRLVPLPEPAGKVRIIAMLDPWTQWLLYPLHAQLFRLFERTPCDGTHDQQKPLRELIEWCQTRKQKEIFSFDLTAATDRLPVSIQSDILNFMLGSHLGDSWASLLVDRSYAVSHFLSGTEPLRYAVGQPMGAYSSWAMLNLSHHLIVQFAYHRAAVEDEYLWGLGPWFKGYAVLGDDVVIAHRKVADQYLLIMKELGVGVNTSKSLISNNGSAEFAKRFILMYKDASPLSWKELAVATKSVMVAIEVCRKLLSVRKVGLKTLFDIYQHGYQTKSRMLSAISSLGTTSGGLVLAWLFAFQGFSLETFLATSFNNMKPVVSGSMVTLRGAFIGFVKDAVKAFHERSGIYSFESNYIERIGKTLTAPEKSTRIGRFLFRAGWAAAIYGPIYKAVQSGLTQVTEIRNILELYERKVVRMTGLVSAFAEADLRKLVDLTDRVEELRALIPGDLRHRPAERPLKRWSSRVRMALTFRRGQSRSKRGK